MDEIRHQLKLYGYKSNTIIEIIFKYYKNLKIKKHINSSNINHDIREATKEYIRSELEIIDVTKNFDTIDLISFFPEVKVKNESSFYDSVLNKYKYYDGFTDSLKKIKQNFNEEQFVSKVKKEYPKISQKNLEKAIMNIKSFKSYNPINRWMLFEIDEIKFVKDWLKSFGNRYELAVGCHIKNNNIPCPNCNKKTIKKAGGGYNSYIDLVCKNCKTIFEIKSKRKFDINMKNYFGGSYYGFKSIPKEYQIILLIVDSDTNKVYISKNIEILPRVEPRTFSKNNSPLYTYINLQDELEEWFTIKNILSEKEHNLIVDNIVNNIDDLCKTYKSISL